MSLHLGGADTWKITLNTTVPWTPRIIGFNNLVAEVSVQSDAEEDNAFTCIQENVLHICGMAAFTPLMLLNITLYTRLYLHAFYTTSFILISNVCCIRS